jgi:hypothetical protein
MPTTRPTITLTLTLLASALLLPGCTGVSPTVWHGSDHSIAATYGMGELVATLPRMAVPAAAGAASATLLARGYVITTSRQTRDRAYLSATSRVDTREYPTDIQIALNTPGSCRVTIRSGSWSGDEPVSRAILDDMLARLGR